VRGGKKNTMGGGPVKKGKSPWVFKIASLNKEGVLRATHEKGDV